MTLEALAALLADELREGRVELPLLPEVVTRVLAATDDARSDARVLAELVKRDPSLAAHLLRRANSPNYRGQEPIVTLQHAVSRLGASGVRELALMVTCNERIFQARGFEDEVRSAYRHSLATALFAREIGRLVRASPDEAFLAGLVHDVGRPVLLQKVVDLQSREGLRAERADVFAAVHALHASTGALLVARWRLPERLGEALRLHHEPAEHPLAAAVALADALAHETLGDHDGASGRVDPSTHPACAVLNLYPDAMETLRSKGDAVRAAVAEAT